MTDSLILRCDRCGANNLVPEHKLAEGLAPRCSQCKAALATAPAPLIVTDASYAADVERSPLPVLLDAWAPWCGPCRVVAPSVDELARELAGKVRVAKLNVDENQQTAARFDIRSIPTLLVLARGREVDRIVGAQSKAAILEHLQRAIAGVR